MSGKHTPGPWIQYEGATVGACTIGVPIEGALGFLKIAHVLNYTDELKGNGRLIAAAPDLEKLALHIMAMADDSYLAGHPEWAEIVTEAASALAKVNER